MCTMENILISLVVVVLISVAVRCVEAGKPKTDFRLKRPNFNTELEYDYHDIPLKRYPPPTSASPKPKRPLRPIPPIVVGPVPPFWVPLPTLGSLQVQAQQEQDVQIDHDNGIDAGVNLKKGANRFCPEPNGFFPHEKQCDTYYECVDFEAYEKVCPDGLVFVKGAPSLEKCEFHYAIDCSARPGLQKPQQTTNCKRRYGFFIDESDCGKYYHCLNGIAKLTNCAAGLVFSSKTATCIFPNMKKRISCNLESPEPTSGWEQKQVEFTRTNYSMFTNEEEEGSLSLDFD